MGVAAENDVDAGDPARHLLVHVKAVMAQHHDDLGSFGADLVDHGLHVLFADAEGEFGKHPARVGDRHIGKGLADDRDLDATAFEELVGFEQLCRLVPFGVKDVLAQRGKGQAFDQFGDPVGAQGEFPVKGHRIGLQRVHHVDHILPLGVVAGIGAVPGIAAVQQQRVGPVGADGVHHVGDPVHAAHPAICPGQRREIVIGQRIGRGAAILDPVEAAEIGAGDMGHLPLGRADAQVHLGLAEIDRHQLGVDVGDMDQGQVAERVEFQELVLGQRLLRGQPGPIAKAGGPHQGRCGHGNLKKIATGDHEAAFS